MSEPERNAAARYFSLAASVAVMYAFGVAVKGVSGGDIDRQWGDVLCGV